MRACWRWCVAGTVSDDGFIILWADDPMAEQTAAASPGGTIWLARTAATRGWSKPAAAEAGWRLSAKMPCGLPGDSGNGR